MTTTTRKTPTSRLRFGTARADITPPVGIYHRMWGAASHDRAAGVHRPLFADALALLPRAGDGPGLLRLLIDLVGLGKNELDELTQSAANASGIPAQNVVVTFSHTHSAGMMTPDRIPLPGGDLIPGYLVELNAAVSSISRAAVANAQDAVISYAAGRCDLAANRDCWDAERGIFVCGYNQSTPADDTLLVGRVTAANGSLLATLVNYACHPTTLAWGNQLISPDYVGSLRETVEEATGAVCLFLLGACGELGPVQGFVGDPAVADRNGRQVAYAALSALSSLGPPAADFAYSGPVVSGATLGAWDFAPHDAQRQAESSQFSGGLSPLHLTTRTRPNPDALSADLEEWETRAEEALKEGRNHAASEARAMAERSRRWLARLQHIPSAGTAPFHYAVYRLGDAMWVTCGGEPYSLLQVELRRRFPEWTIFVSPLSGDMHLAYLLPRDRYGLGLYQEEPSIPAAGCLEMLIEAIAERVAVLG
ncbi:MAG: hypothetical protein DWI57_02370 [Chloroflexi bacterium]|nr:MAG: hypothetical protein DWI57_02370 [Chloroflexota bacterium]